MSSFPPTVIHITDGESTDGDPTNTAENIKKLATNDGNVLLFNLHFSSNRAIPISYPDNESGLPDQYAQMLFRISSTLPDHIRDAAKKESYRVSEESRGFAFNADIVELIRFVEIGTRPSNLR